MASARCPVHARNKQQHEDFLAHFRDFKQRFKSQGFNPDILRKLHRFMSEWIEAHLSRVDTQLKPCLVAGRNASPRTPTVAGAACNDARSL